MLICSYNFELKNPSLINCAHFHKVHVSSLHKIVASSSNLPLIASEMVGVQYLCMRPLMVYMLNCHLLHPMHPWDTFHIRDKLILVWSPMGATSLKINGFVLVVWMENSYNLIGLQWSTLRQHQHMLKIVYRKDMNILRGVIYIQHGN